MSFSQNLTKAAEERGLTLSSLAEKAKLAPETITAWTNSSAYPQIDEMKKLSRVLGIDAESLIPDDEIDQYINFSLNSGSSSSAFGDVLLVGAIMIGLVLGFMTSSFTVGAVGVVCGTAVGFLLRKLYISKK